MLPTHDKLVNALGLVTEDINQDLEGNLVHMHQKLNKIVEAATNVPREMGKEFNKRMKELLRDITDNLRQRDAVFLKEIAVHKVVVVSLQESNAEQIKLLADKVFDLNSSLFKFQNSMIDCTDNTLALVHQQSYQVAT